MRITYWSIKSIFYLLLTPVVPCSKLFFSFPPSLSPPDVKFVTQLFSLKNKFVLSDVHWYFCSLAFLFLIFSRSFCERQEERESEMLKRDCYLRWEKLWQSVKLHWKTVRSMGEGVRADMRGKGRKKERKKGGWVQEQVQVSKMEWERERRRRRRRRRWCRRMQLVKTQMRWEEADWCETSFARLYSIHCRCQSEPGFLCVILTHKPNLRNQANNQL